MKKKLYILTLFQMLIISAFGITVTTTAPNTGVSKVMTVDNGKVYELNFNTNLLSSSKVEVNIKELGSTIASQQISTNGNKALTFTPTSNAITIEFNRINSGTATLQFEVDNIQLKEVVSSKLTHKVGTKNYEVSDHLGNVRTTVSDKKDNGSSKVISVNDYYPFGMEARSVSNGEYRYGFNGMEKDDEMTEGNYDFGARIYGSRLGRWLAVDPLAAKYSSFSPYQGVGNNPILLIDIDGREIIISAAEGQSPAKLQKFALRVFSDLGKLSNDQLSLTKRSDGTYKIKVINQDVRNQDKKLTVGTNLIRNLDQTDLTINIQEGTSNTAMATDTKASEGGEGSGSVVSYNPNDTETELVGEKGNMKKDPYISLAHELIHAELNSVGEKNLKNTGIDNPDSDVHKHEEDNTLAGKLHVSEWLTRKKENEIRSEQGKGKRLLKTGEGTKNLEYPVRGETYDVIKK